MCLEFFFMVVWEEVRWESLVSRSHCGGFLFNLFVGG
jgi:hypothetical protein